MNHYFQTTPLTVDEVRDALRSAKSQEVAILAVFRRLHRSALTPSYVHSVFQRIGRKWPITSIRRAMSVLAADDGPLIKTDMVVRGPQGRPEHLWRLA